MAAAVRRPSLFFRPARRPLALACLAVVVCGARAQATSEALPAVTVTGQAPTARAEVAGFGTMPLARTPLAATVIPEGELKDRGATRIADTVSLEASISDSYNAQGYWDFLSVRGFVLDNRFNYRRDGLPINAETSIPLDNKAAVEVLKGTSGIQAGTSAPGGLVNLVVKRPEGQVRSVELGWRSRQTVGLAADLGERFGTDERFGLRINAAYEHLDSPLRSDTGHRRLLAAAGDWRLSPATVVEAEVETSRRSQPSQPAFSLLGSTLPAAGDPRINLNNQTWSLPVVMDALTASLRVRHQLDPDWRLTAHLGTQRLLTDDRLAFPYGCDAEGNYDRYCSDGSFDLYEYVSDDEHRRTHALDLHADGKILLGGMQHSLTTGVLFSRYTARLQDQIYRWAGTGTVDGQTQVPPSDRQTDPNTNRSERSTEFYVRDAVELAPRWTAWVGVRHTRLHRATERTSGDPEATAYRQSFTTPWLALSHEFRPRHMVYASWGRGVESEVVPNRARYTNAGQALPGLKSRQVELGLKGRSDALQWGLAWFDIQRPAVSDIGSDCFDDSTGDTCTRQFDGQARHRGLEGHTTWDLGPWRIHGSAMWLHARREGAADPSLNGKRPVNVPAHTVKAGIEYRVSALPGLRLAASLVHEGDRMVLADNSVRIPSWTRWDLGLVHQHRMAGTTLTWRAGIDNLTDRRAWRESPFQYGHAFLYPLAPRSMRLSLQADL
ncbi:MAG: ferric siderophore receptor [Caldimonas sp.]|uniref:TonB-dependent siderophore receptor n=1 Tax=Caldimonas taiwanensis TaxID=307483 RepID=UPI00078254CA|nr:TonB-dependent siderophore receptor [Caldimonas taiwanensis]GIX23698.1 MAG: ferric siderophore receptor [Caldimonas sp.]